MSALLEPQNYKVAILAGGISGEREVSLSSGKGAKLALEAAGFSVTMLDPANKEDLKTLIDGNFDVAFICLHGRYGEDGTMQGFLEIAGIPYVGSGVWSSAASMDKAKAKIFYEIADIATPKALVLSTKTDKAPAQIVAEIGLPCVVKPASEGSALGVYIVENENDLEAALDAAFELQCDVLVERYVAGRELTVAVLGNSEPYALPIIEIIPRNEFYDYDAKYAPGGSEHICPAKLEESITEKVQQMAIAAHKVLDCEGMSRSDFIVDHSGDVWILETNTIPGMTETSLLPDAGRAAGMDFAELCTRLIEFALEG